MVGAYRGRNPSRRCRPTRQPLAAGPAATVVTAATVFLAGAAVAATTVAATGLRTFHLLLFGFASVTTDDAAAPLPSPPRPSPRRRRRRAAAAAATIAHTKVIHCFMETG